MDSLYGGHEGVSFVIRASFSSIADMVSAFKGGSSYTEVWYGEFCIIDTPNKNDADNGKVYKRGLNYQATNGDAIYIGQIVGPSSGTPYFQMNTIAEVTKHSEEELGEYEYRRFPVGKDANGNYITSDGSDGKAIQTFNFNTANALVPGKKSDGTFNDNIKYTWCNIRKDNADADSWFYVGWQIPYLVTDYGIHMTSPYDKNGSILKDATEIARVDDGKHPYYEKWDLGLPKGVKGDTLRNLRVITPTNTNKTNIYASSAFTVNSTTGETVVGAAGYPGIDDDIAEGRKIVVFDYYVYDKKLNPTPYQIYLGDFNIITGITVADDGTLTITYSHNDNSVFSKKIKWVKAASLTTGDGSAGGRFTIEYNNGDTSYTANLTWVKGIEISQDGTVTYTYSGTNGGTLPANGKRPIEKLIQWINNVTLNTNNGNFHIDYNTGKVYDTTLNWVKDITFNESNGNITVRHTTGDVTASGRLKLINGANVSSTGRITFTTNTGETIIVRAEGAENAFQLKMVENVILNTGITDDKRIRIKYNTQTEPQPIGNPINYVQDLVVRPSDYHMFVLFSDPTKRVTDADLDEDSKDAAGNVWVNSNEIVSFYPLLSQDERGSTVYWRDYGAIKDQAGILIGFNLSYETVKEWADAGNDGLDSSGNPDPLKYLNANFPTGLTGEQNVLGTGIGTKGKVVSYSPQPETEDKQDKDFYAYDYNSGKWFYLGKISDTGMRDVILISNTQTTSDTYKTLNTKGLAFRYTSATKNDEAIPTYWNPTYSGNFS